MSETIIQRAAQTTSGLVGDVGWDSVVRSMQGALDDRSHVTHLGYAIAAVAFVWINYRLAKWIMRHLESAQHSG
jgi:small neutral amino acid transporter SnatA (MarC family)